MNLELLGRFAPAPPFAPQSHANLPLPADPSAQDYPETIEDCLDDGMGVVCAFNRRGTLLAVGCNDGRSALLAAL